MREVNGKSYDEITAITRCNLGTIKSRLNVHFLSGTSIGLWNVYLDVSLRTLWLIAIALLIAWEVAEFAWGVREQAENRVIDIFVGALGIYAATSLAPALSRPAQQAAFIASAVVLTVGCFLGWGAYRRRTKRVSRR